MTKKINLKLEAARIVNKHFSKGSRVKLSESQYLNGLSFLDGAKGMLSDVMPANVELSDTAVYAEVDPSTIQIKSTEKDVINKNSNFYVVMDMSKIQLVILDKSGNCLVYKAPSIKSFRTVLSTITKILGDDSALAQVGFKS